MTELKRGQNSRDHQALTSDVPKRKKVDISTSMSSKESKEKIGERIVALQQLVSPFGKTDTASVLLEAMEYISFLHDQVKVLSAPYLHCSPVTKTDEGAEQYSLRNRGLCLVPTSNTAGLARSNGADIWAPIKSSPPGL